MNRWTIPLTVLAAIVGFVVVISIAVLFVLGTGSVSVGADVKPGLIVRTLAPWGRDRSVQRHAPKVKNPYAGDPNAIAEGLDQYRENCLLCHGAPGLPISEVSRGLEPPAPSLGKEEIDTPDGELFWVTKHGIRLTSMPAFGYALSDDDIWKILAFVRHLPELTAEERGFLREAASEEEVHHPDARSPQAAGRTEQPRGAQAGDSGHSEDQPRH
jgi:mono/diheme cytochrome c family protein